MEVRSIKSPEVQQAEASSIDIENLIMMVQLQRGEIIEKQLKGHIDHLRVSKQVMGQLGRIIENLQKAVREGRCLRSTDKIKLEPPINGMSECTIKDFLTMVAGMSNLPLETFHLPALDLLKLGPWWMGVILIVLHLLQGRSWGAEQNARIAQQANSRTVQMNNMSQEDMTRVQRLNNKRDEVYSELSNLLSSWGRSRHNLAENLR